MASSLSRLQKCKRLLALNNRRSLILSSKLAKGDGEDSTEPSDVSDEVASLQDVSRMPKRYHDQMLHVLNPPEALDYYTEIHTGINKKKRQLAHFGKSSGIDLGLYWPSAEELKETIEFEKEWEPSLQVRWMKLETAKKLEAEEKRKKVAIVEGEMAKMPQKIEQYKARLAKAEEKEQQVELKRKALLDEARDYYGYSIDPKDPRFEQMKEKKEEEEKLLKKKKKKEEKQAKFMSFAASAQKPQDQ